MQKTKQLGYCLHNNPQEYKIKDNNYGLKKLEYIWKKGIYKGLACIVVCGLEHDIQP